MIHHVARAGSLNQPRGRAGMVPLELADHGGVTHQLAGLDGLDSASGQQQGKDKGFHRLYFHVRSTIARSVSSRASFTSLMK